VTTTTRVLAVLASVTLPEAKPYADPTVRVVNAIGVVPMRS
jgi:hypothetical protein